MIRYTGIASIDKKSSLGDPFRVYREVPEIPRIDDRFLDCSVYLYPTEADAKRGERIGASGFLVAVPGSGSGWLLNSTCPRGDLHHLYAVSNRHVIQSPKPNFVPKPVVRLNSHRGESAILPFTVPDWTLELRPQNWTTGWRFLLHT
jgi:hypothetical protein